MGIVLLPHRRQASASLFRSPTVCHLCHLFATCERALVLQHCEACIDVCTSRRSGYDLIEYHKRGASDVVGIDIVSMAVERAGMSTHVARSSNHTRNSHGEHVSMVVACSLRSIHVRSDGLGWEAERHGLHVCVFVCVCVHRSFHQVRSRIRVQPPAGQSACTGGGLLHMA